jgi:hypothetical protein
MARGDYLDVDAEVDPDVEGSPVPSLELDSVTGTHSPIPQRVPVPTQSNPGAQSTSPPHCPGGTAVQT